MSRDEASRIAVVRRYFDACNSGHLDELLATLHPDVTHVFLPTAVPSLRGAASLARHWQSFQQAVRPLWRIERIVASGDDVVNEWSCEWTPAGTARRVLTRGTEWYLVRKGRITEIRAYVAVAAGGAAFEAAAAYAEPGAVLEQE
jgi:ketosteroid isomerase-like protein